MISAKKIYYCKCKNNAVLSLPTFFGFRRSGIVPFPLAVPRWKSWADAVRSVDGETLYYRKIYTNFFSANAASVRRRAFRYHHAYILAVGAGAPTLQFYRFQAVGYCAFSLVGNAHRAFRGEKHGRMPFGRSTVKHKIDESILCHINISTHAMSVRRRAFRYNHVYILAVGAGAPTLQFVRIGFRL